MSSLTTSAVTEPPISVSQYCTFWADGNYFGIHVTDVQEVLRYQEMTAAPGAPGPVFGLINLRGQIVTAVDLRARLGLAERPADQLPMNVVVRSRGEVVSLLVDDIGDVVNTGDIPIKPTPATLPAPIRETVSGVIPLSNAILLLLDANKTGDATTDHATESTPK